jgi:hypothetical protein
MTQLLPHNMDRPSVWGVCAGDIGNEDVGLVQQIAALVSLVCEGAARGAQHNAAAADVLQTHTLCTTGRTFIALWGCTQCLIPKDSL